MQASGLRVPDTKPSSVITYECACREASDRGSRLRGILGLGSSDMGFPGEFGVVATVGGVGAEGNKTLGFWWLRGVGQPV